MTTKFPNTPLGQSRKRATKPNRELRRAYYFSRPELPSRTSSSLRVTKISPAAAQNIIDQTEPAGLDVLDRYGARGTSAHTSRTENDLAYLYY